MKTEVSFSLIVALFAYVGQSMASVSDSLSHRPSFSVEYTGEVQSDFKHAKFVNLLQLGAEIPLSRLVSLNLSSVSVATTDEEPLVENLQGYSNIDAENLPFALAVAGLSWQVNDRHSLFAGIRRVDEDYFCSDVLSLFTASTCGGFPTITANHDIPAYPASALGLHYAFEKEHFALQASFYNGTGHTKFGGKDHIFRFSPKEDGLFLMSQAEYRHGGSGYFLGGSLHYGGHTGTDDHHVRPILWAYAEQAVGERLHLLAAYSHAFCDDNSCRHFCGIGGKYTFPRADIGVFSDYVRIDGQDEWATEFTCNIQCTGSISLQPVLHVLATDGHAHCVGILRLGISL